MPKKDERVWDRGHNIYGVATGGTRACALEGCSGKRVCVRWPDGKHTWPCSKGLKQNEDGSWEII